MRHGGGGGGGGGAGDRGAVHPADGRAVLQHLRHQVNIVNMSLFQSYHTTLFQIQERRAGEVRGRVREEVPHRAEDQDLRPHAQDVQEAARQEV